LIGKRFACKYFCLGEKARESGADPSRWVKLLVGGELDTLSGSRKESRH